MNETIYWNLPPVVGEIHGLDCVIICKPKDTICPLTYTIIYNDNTSESYLIRCSLYQPTRLIIPFREEGYHLIRWIQAGKTIYEHGINITDIPQRFIFVSCDLLEADVSKSHSMWTVMNQELLIQKPTVLVHLGDQAYMDVIFNEAVKFVNDNGRDSLTRQAVINMFGKRYQETWIPHHQILSAMSNYFLWDDHEIKNNVMLTDKLSKNKSFVRNCAVVAYEQYQCSAHIRNDFNKLSDYSWIKIFDDLAMIAIERTSRAISIDEVINLIQEINVNRIILCFSAPVIPRPHHFYGYCYKKLTNDQGTYETSKFWPLQDLLKLYRALINWKSQSESHDIIVIGGDLHLGLHGIIEQKDISIPVVIASPITNEPTLDRWLASKGLEGTQELSDGFNSEDTGYPITFRTISTKARRCYCVVNTDVSPMKIMMHYCDKKHPQSKSKYLKQLWNSK